MAILNDLHTMSVQNGLYLCFFHVHRTTLYSEAVVSLGQSSGGGGRVIKSRWPMGHCGCHDGTRKAHG